MSPATSKVYDEEYFERWYRDPRYAVIHQEVLARRVQLAISATEFLLERPIRSVLDVGCGEAPWRALVKHARPKARYLGIDSSEYAVKRYGKTRNIRYGRFGDIGDMGDERIERRPPLGRVESCNGGAVSRVGAEAVDGLGREGHEAAGGEQARGVADRRRIRLGHACRQQGCHGVPRMPR